MSANLTVYAMAMAAEAPSRARAAERAAQAALAEEASRQNSGALIRRLASAIHGVHRREIAGGSVDRPEEGRVAVAPLAG